MQNFGLIHVLTFTHVILVLDCEVTTNSPPTRDSSARQPLTGDDKIMQEIKRLRLEMEKCMKQIREIQKTATQGLQSDLMT